METEKDPGFRKKYEGRATELTVSPVERQNVQLHVIPAGEIKQPRPCSSHALLTSLALARRNSRIGTVWPRIK